MIVYLKIIILIFNQKIKLSSNDILFIHKKNFFNFHLIGLYKNNNKNYNRNILKNFLNKKILFEL